MQTENQFGYFAKDVSLQLDINANTLRRWSIELEKSGYKFKRNENNQRIYYEKDFKAFRKLKELLNKNISMDNAVHSVASMLQATSQTPTVYQNNDDEVRLSRRDLQEIIREEVQKAIEEEREAAFHAFEQKMNNTIEKRDYELIKLLRETQETQLLTATTKEKRRKRWFNLFRK